jgi:hypothetical protein
MADGHLCADPGENSDVRSIVNDTLEPDQATGTVLSHSLSAPCVSESQRTISTTDATCVSPSEDHFSDPRSVASAREPAEVGGNTVSRRCMEAPGRDVAKDTHKQFCTRLRLADLNAPIRYHGDDITLVGKAASMPLGNSYQDMCIGGNARVHMGDHFGDEIINIHASFDVAVAMDHRHFHNAEPEKRAELVRLAVSLLAVAIIHTITEHLFIFMRLAYRAAPTAARQHVPSLLNLIGYRYTRFEDALGRIELIDIDAIASWPAFNYKLTSAFKDQPGYRRVAVAGYRLFDQARGSRLIDPKDPPPFTMVFRAKAYLQMSIHFEESEVPLDCCPKCGLVQACKTGLETTCKSKKCNFHYRGQFEERRVEEIDGDVEYEERNIREQHKNARKRLLKDERENPARFSRISVSQQPTALPAASSVSHTRVSSKRLHTQSVVANIRGRAQPIQTPIPASEHSTLRESISQRLGTCRTFGCTGMPTTYSNFCYTRKSPLPQLSL